MAQQPSQAQGYSGLPPYIHNHGLFQEYYLANLWVEGLPSVPRYGPETGEAKELEASIQETEDVSAALASVTKLWGTWESKLAINEEAVSDFVKRVCEALNMIPLGQSTIPRLGASTHRADLVLFGSNEAVTRFADHSTKKDTNDAARLYGDALAVVEIERLGANLDKGANKPAHDGTALTNVSPPQQIVSYLISTDLSWGILTDGVRWRIYHNFHPPRYDSYLEVDLRAILQISDAVERSQAFFWFYTFFSAAAFRRNAGAPPESGGAFLDTVLQGSVQHSVAVQDTLREQAHGALEALAQGIYAAFQLKPKLAELPRIYEQATTILYRLLFIKFAEDMEILPVHNAAYREQYGFGNRERQMLAALDSKPDLMGRSARFTDSWDGLLNFFDAINIGDPQVGIEHGYNGGLFKPERLQGVAIPDYYMALAIDKLARITTGHGRNQRKLRVSYKELDLRHLGSIYEGLLEQQLVQQNEEIRLIKTLSEGGNPNKRKATGSYYTPDYIVDNIVQAAIDPLCKGKSATYIESLNILDPAMGSGHFLVTALGRLALHHARALKLAKIHRVPGEPDETYQLRRAQAEPDEEERLTSARKLVDRCIYGVDLNPLAVELAKLALWLFTLSPDQPLTFLDHHLRVGNSLLGAQLNELLVQEPLTPAQKAARTKALQRTEQAVAAGQLSMLDENSFQQALGTAVGQMGKIEARVAYTLADVHEQERLYNELRKALNAKYGRLANLVTATRIQPELRVTPQEWKTLVEYISKQSNVPRKLAEKLEAADKVAEQHKFFHWELEFVDVFFDEAGQPKTNVGFDAVVGNPPYIRIQTLASRTPEQAEYFKQEYTTAGKGNYDIYALFVEKGLRLLNNTGRLGFIVPHKFFNAQYGEALRALLAKGKHLSEIVHFGGAQVFEGVSTYTCLLFLQKAGAEQFEVEQVSNLSDWRQKGRAPRTVLSQSLISAAEWNFPTSAGPSATPGVDTGAWGILFDKLDAMPTKLGDVAQLFVGLQTDADAVFILEEVSRDGQRVLCQSKATGREHWFEDEHLKPFLKGSLNIRRYYLSDLTKRLIFPYEMVNGKSLLISEAVYKKRYPLTWAYLEENKETLCKRNKGRMGAQWYGYVYKKNHTRFTSPKLVVPSIATGSAFAADLEGTYYFVGSGGGGGGGYGIIIRTDAGISYRYLLGLLNSQLLSRFLRNISTPFRGGYIALNRQYIEQLPIHIVRPTEKDETDWQAKIEQLVTWMLTLHDKLANATKDTEKEATRASIADTNQEIDRLVYNLYELTKNEIALVEQGRT